MFQLTVEGQFSAAHQIRGHDGMNGKLHGHNYRVIVRMAGDSLNELGILVDYAVVRDSLTHVITRLEHEYLNDLELFRGLQPTCELTAQLIFRHLKQDLYGGKGLPESVRLQEVIVNESDKQGVTYSE